MGNATMILSSDEVRNALDLESDEITESECIELSQRASDYILKITGMDWGKDGSTLAKQVSEFLVSDWYNRTSTYRETINLYLADLQEIAMRGDSDEQA